MSSKEQKKAQIYNELDQMLTDLESHVRSSNKLHEVEGGIFKGLLSIGFSLLKYYIFLVQESLSYCGPSSAARSAHYRNKGESRRNYRSVFGLIKIERTKYYSSCSKRCYFPLDEALGLPETSYSYLLADWLSYESVEMDFAQSVGLLSRVLNQDLYGMQSARCSYAFAQEVESYYEAQAVKVIPKDHTHFSLGFDGKGIPIRRSETDRADEGTAIRLGRGKKKDVKKEATVSLTSSFSARPRGPEQILNALFKEESDDFPAIDGKQFRWHEEQHLRAFLSNKSKAIEYGVQQMLKRDPKEITPFVVLIDGAPSLENAVIKAVSKYQVEHRVEAYILDFIHVLEYVWKVANAHLGEKHPGRKDWVKLQAKMLLKSQYQEVIEQWREILETQKLSEYKKGLLQRSINYLSNRPHMIDYKTYLKRGFPITTGAIESACGHFIKSRMERNAMHWSKEGAQKMLDIRAVKKNQDWEDFVQYKIDTEQQKLYRRAA